MDKASSMLILSWNVAGLSTTVNRIHENYRPAKAKSSLPSSVALAEYFARHQVDICCLQEHKIPKQQLTSRSEPRLASTVDGYESFWSCCVDEKKKGLNGVVTYARKGSVISADSSPLGSPDLDQQGRCVMTDHEHFVLFNVYVPASGGQPLSYKMKFLNALRRAMRHQRNVRKKPVILVGDLNIARSKQDIYWKDRAIFVKDIIDEVQQSGTPESLPKWKVDLANHWGTIEKVLETKEVVATQTTNSRTKEKYDKFRLAVTVNDRRVFLGSHEVSPDYCTYCYEFEERHYVDEETDERHLAGERNVVRIQILVELMAKIVGVNWDEKVQRAMANTAGSIQRTSPPRKWLASILEDDGMVDAFRHFWPTAEARFTCWHQFTNRRYVNDGSRIDYTICDQSLMELVLKGAVEKLRSCGNVEDGSSDGTSEDEALRAATANGRFQPVAFEGGGISDATQEALDTQFGEPHTGMVYTPPSFSDHIAVSLLMKDEVLARDLHLNEKDSGTRKAQPHKVQRSVASFFQNTGKADAAQSRKVGAKLAAGNASSEKPGKRFKTASQKKPPANSILHHFRKQS